ncbi:hypothetical protein [Mammaliicoccus vitulinus]|uniref:hypothetical protein n=1 Tax=Mammaliicoccus vitulinus TaxID=71237 RepID=UPI00248C49FD|nr:hypothetical protein [Mammaliicoccus vitulinus]
MNVIGLILNYIAGPSIEQISSKYNNLNYLVGFLPILTICLLWVIAYIIYEIFFDDNSKTTLNTKQKKIIDKKEAQKNKKARAYWKGKANSPYDV